MCVIVGIGVFVKAWVAIRVGVLGCVLVLVGLTGGIVGEGRIVVALASAGWGGEVGAGWEQAVQMTRSNTHKTAGNFFMGITFLNGIKYTTVNNSGWEVTSFFDKSPRLC